MYGVTELRGCVLERSSSEKLVVALDISALYANDSELKSAEEVQQSWRWWWDEEGGNSKSGRWPSTLPNRIGNSFPSSIFSENSKQLRVHHAK